MIHGNLLATGSDVAEHHYFGLDAAQFGLHVGATRPDRGNSTYSITHRYQ